MLNQALGREPRTVQEEITSGSAAELLREMGPEARDALPALVGLFRSGGTRHTQRRAAIAIRCIDPKTYTGLGLPGLLALP